MILIVMTMVFSSKNKKNKNKNENENENKHNITHQNTAQAPMPCARARYTIADSIWKVASRVNEISEFEDLSAFCQFKMRLPAAFTLN